MLSLVRHKKQGQHNHEKGFTIIEVTVALVIFVIGILGCYQLQLKSTQTNTLANSVGTAATWASYVVEDLLAKDYYDLEADSGAGPAGLDDTEGNADGVLYIRPDGSTDTAAAADDLYSVSWNIAEGTSAAAATGQPVLAQTKQIRVIVIKKGGIGKGTLYTHDYFKTSDIL